MNDADLKKLDPKVRDYVKEINSLPFVRTLFSCQGHFCKSKQKAMVYYSEQDGTTHKFDGAWSRFKNPFVLLEFSDARLAKKFATMWTRLRLPILKDNSFLHIITPKNLAYAKAHFANLGNAFVVSRYGRKFASVSFVFFSHFELPYYEAKRVADKAVATARYGVFSTVMRLLRVVEKWMKKNERRTATIYKPIS